MKSLSPEKTIRTIYHALAQAWGPQHWWPAESAFEVVIGAILTQNTSWKNVERAMTNLRANNALTLNAVREMPLAKLEELVRPSGYFRQKAERLKNFVAFVDAQYAGSLEQMFAAPTAELRAELLAQKGIGLETADAILLYAGNHEVFVVDAYAKRVLERHGVTASSAKYEEIRRLVESALGAQKFASDGIALPDAAASGDRPRPPVHEPSPMSQIIRSPLAQVYNEMHGLFVQAGKHFCLKQDPLCVPCPLKFLLGEDQLRHVVEVGGQIQMRNRGTPTVSRRKKRG